MYAISVLKADIQQTSLKKPVKTVINIYKVREIYFRYYPEI